MLGFAGIIGIVSFVLAVALLQFVRSDVDGMHQYISYFVHGPRGWIFVVGTTVHGIGNFALSLGLRRALGRSRIAAWSTGLLATAALGIIAAGAFSIDPPGQGPTLSGIAHRAVTTGSFPVELASLFMFSVAFGTSPAWRHRQRTSFVLTAFAATASLGFGLAVLLNLLPGLAERLALGSFMLWEFWVASLLLRGSSDQGGD